MKSILYLILNFLFGWLFGKIDIKKSVRSIETTPFVNRPEPEVKPTTKAKFSPPKNNRKHNRSRKFQKIFMGTQPGRIGPVTRFIRHEAPNKV